MHYLTRDFPILYDRNFFFHSNLRVTRHLSFLTFGTIQNNMFYIGSRSLPDSALQRACYVVRFLLADRYDLRNTYYKTYGRFAVMSENEVTLDIPEHSDLEEFYNTRARGLGATLSVQ